MQKGKCNDCLDQFRPNPNDICCEQLSGGTTGLPKGIPRTHNDYVCQWQGYAGLAGHTDESVVLVTIPVAHNATFITMSGPALLLGGTIVLTKSPRPKESFELIERYGVTYTTLIPVQVTYWKENPWTNPMTYPNGNGDGSLVYPGSDGPVNSIRWELVRDGTEDYDMLTLLRRRRDSAPQGMRADIDRLLSFDAVTASFTDYLDSPGPLEAHREAAGEMLHRLAAAADAK